MTPPYHWFPREMTSEKRAQKFHTDDASLPRYLVVFLILDEANFQPIRSTTPDLGSDTSSVWNFCARFSDFISRGDQWWCSEMSAVFFLVQWSFSNDDSDGNENVGCKVNFSLQLQPSPISQPSLKTVGYRILRVFFPKLEFLCILFFL